MQPRDLEPYLHEHIRLSRAMQVSIVVASFDGEFVALAGGRGERDADS
jgi:hypothetical protein